MDNFILVLEASGREAFKKACNLAFMDNSTAAAFNTSGNSFILYWHDYAGTTALPYKMSEEAAEIMIWEWLTKHAKYPKEPDIDGSVSKGFLIEAGHDRLYKGQELDRYAMLKVTAVWAEHHK